jgi:hypothetical protein
MAHPCDYFAKYVLAQNWDSDLSVDHINRVFKSYDLPFYKEDSFNELMGGFHVPNGFDFADKGSSKTRQFMEEEKISALWDPKGDDERVFSDVVEGSALMKLDIHTLIMGGVPSDVISDKVNGKYGLMVHPITARMVETYAHYFWNRDRVSLYDWVDILGGYPSEDRLKEALYGGPQQALYQCGFKPKVDVYAAVREVHRQAYFRLEGLRSSATNQRTTQVFSALSSKILASHEIMTAHGAGLQDQLKQFRQIMMKHQDPDIKQVDTLINKLEGGSYSGEVKQASSED